MVEFFSGGLLERFWNGRAGIVHENIEAAKLRHGFCDRVLCRVLVGCVGLNRKSLTARDFNGLNYLLGGICSLDIGNGDASPVGGEPLGDASSDTA